ncbi:KilA-N domain-containing protein [Capnocytophaga leadbetteri]
MNVLHYIYNGKTIDFSLADNNIMINATQMANAFDKRVDVFLKTDHAQSYIKALEKAYNSPNFNINLRDNLPPNGGRITENRGENIPILPPNGGRITEDEGENMSFLTHFVARIIDYRGRNGVFFERRLALKFAAWLDVEFEIWIYTTIDRLLLGHFRELKEATTEKLLAQQALEDKRKELLRKHPNDFAEFLAIENKLNLSNKRRQRALKESLNALQLELF